MMAGFGGIKVLSVDYRMPPDHLYPAALDDAMTVWKAAQKMAPAKNMGIIGSSAGGGLTLSMVLKAKMDKLPLPGAIAPGTPMSDLTGAGDSFQTNAMVDNVLVAYGASCDVRAAHVREWARSQGSPAVARLWRHGRLSADHTQHRHARFAVEQHRARPPETAAGGR